MIIDTHAHLMLDQFEGELDAVIERAKAAGVEKIINVGCDLKSCKQAVEMLSVDDCLYATLGLHPYDAADATDAVMADWEKQIKDNERIVAIGECGLDYFKAEVPKDVQEKAFRLQLELAQSLNIPIIIHNREADDDCLKIMDDYKVGAVFHCYGSTAEFARKLWYRGIYTSFTGIITYPKSEELQAVVDEVPMDLFMVETDCPYLAPQKYRGERNEPAYVTEVVAKIGELKNLPEKDVARISTENASEFFLRMA